MVPGLCFLFCAQHYKFLRIFGFRRLYLDAAITLVDKADKLTKINNKYIVFATVLLVGTSYHNNFNHGKIVSSIHQFVFIRYLVFDKIPDAYGCFFNEIPMCGIVL